MNTDPRIVLASTSIRRKEILALLGIPFEIVIPDFEEHWNPAYSGKEDAISFALGKAESVKSSFPQSIIIGCDTLIEDTKGKIGKPSDPDDAKQILNRLQGRQHHIWTAIALIDTRGDTTKVTVEQIEIRMRRIDHDEIAHYVATEEALDKAGAYSLQGKGRKFIERLQGDYLSAVGLPIRPICAFLRHRQVHIPLNIDRLYREKNFLNWKTF